MKKNKKKLSLFDCCNTIMMLLVLLVVAYPLYFTIIASVSDASALSAGKVILRPAGFNLEAYRQVLAYKAIWKGYANSAYYTLFGTLLAMFVTIPAAYSLSKKYFPLRNLFTTVVLITMYFGGGLVPTYLLVKSLRLLNTRAILVILGCFSVYNMIIARSYFSTSISDALYEAAEIDGAGEYKKFYAIALPLAKPILAVLVLYYAVGYWNSYFNALMYTSSKAFEPLQLVLRRVLILNENALNIEMLEQVSVDELLIQKARAEAAYVMKYAMVFIGSLPLLIMYPFVQKHFVKGVMIGSVKE